MAEVTDKKADLAGPGIGDYNELEKILPTDYASPLNKKDTQKAIFAAKKYIEENLCKELNLMMVQVPLIVDVESGVNDYLDRDGSRAGFSTCHRGIHYGQSDPHQFCYFLRVSEDCCGYKTVLSYFR